MITPKNKDLSKLVLWEDRGNTLIYKIENNVLLFSHNLNQGGITFDIEDMQEVDFLTAHHLSVLGFKVE